MSVHRRWLLCFGLFALVPIAVLLLTLERTGHASDVPYSEGQPGGDPGSTHSVSYPSALASITITPSGFDPAVLTVTVGSEVTWYNATALTHTLRFGTPPHQIFLPVVWRNRAATSALATGLASQEVRASCNALPPGGTFTHRLLSTGVYHYYLATAPQFSGCVVVQERPPAPGITGGEKPVTPVYRPPLNDPVGLALNAAETVAYVAEKGAGRLVAVDIDPASPTYRGIIPIATGLQDLQMGVALDPSETYAYVVENEPGNLKRVTLSTGQVVTVTTGLYHPHDLALNTSGSVAYVTLDSGALVSVTLATGQVYTVTTDLFRPEGIALAPGGAYAFVAQPDPPIMQVNLLTGATIALGSEKILFANAIALDSSGNTLYVANYALPELRQVNAATGEVQRYGFLPFRISDIVVSATGAKAYVLWRWDGQIAVLDLNTWDAEPVLEFLDHYPTGVALDADETHAYVLEQSSGELSRIGLNPAAPDYGRPVRVAAVGAWEGQGGSLALSADETWALVAKVRHFGDLSLPNLLRVDLTTGLTQTVTSYHFAPVHGVSLSPDEQYAYVTGDDTVKRVDLATGAVTQIGDGAIYGWGLNGHALTADGQTLYVAQRWRNRLLSVDVTSGEIAVVADDLPLPVSVALAPGEATAWVLEEGRGGVLAQVDLASGLTLAEIRLQPWIIFHGSFRFRTGWAGNLAVTADGTAAYIPMAAYYPRYLYRVDLTGSSNVGVLYQPPMLDLTDVVLNQAETRAYLLDAASFTLYQLDLDPTSPASGTLGVLVDGLINEGRALALSADESIFVAIHNDGLLQIRAADGVILRNQWIGYDMKGLALHPTQRIAYVTTGDGGLRAVDLDGDGTSTQVAAGLGDPRRIALNAAGTYAYVVEYSAGRLVRVNLNTGAVSTITASLNRPLDVELDEVGGLAYVLEDAPNNHRISKVTLATGAVTWAYTGEYTARLDGMASAIALSRDCQHVYLARNRPGQLWRVDLAQAATAIVSPTTQVHAVTYHPESVYEEMERQQGGVLSPDGRRLYLGDEFSPRLISLDLADSQVRFVAGLAWPTYFMAVTPDESTLYYTHLYTDNVGVVDLETGATGLVYTGHGTRGLVLDPTDPHFAYATHPPPGEVYRLNLATGDRTILAVQPPDGWSLSADTLTVNRAGTHLYLVFPFGGELGDYAVARYDLAAETTTIVAVVDSQGDWPGTIIVDEAEQYVYVSELGWGGWYGGTRGGAVRRVGVDPASPTYGQVEVVMPDVGEVFPLALDLTGSCLIIGGGMAYVIFQVD
jgi:DNA-binding beta-propeller fold protein YncE